MQAAFNRRRHHRSTAAVSLVRAIWNFGQVGSPSAPPLPRGAVVGVAMGRGTRGCGSGGGAKELNGGQCVVRLFPYAKDVAPANKVSPLASKTDGPSESENLCWATANTITFTNAATQKVGGGPNQVRIRIPDSDPDSGDRDSDQMANKCQTDADLNSF